jgi:hypothetical protein
MKIPDELFKKWEVLRSHGDGKKIAGANQGVTQMDVSRAFSSGECSDKTFNAIAGYYTKKEKKVKAILQ